MGKNKGGSSWLTVVKRAFRSPTKDTQKKTSRRSREDNDQEQDEDEKKREKRRWLFRKHSPNNSATQQNGAKLTKCSAPPPNKTPEVLPPPDHRHAIAVAAATAAAAEAAVATAQAAVEIIRLTRSSNTNINPSSTKQNYAAIIIQKAFRGYLARSALVALRGIVKLQALIRGQNVRKQAKMTLRCMQALLRLQTRMHDHHLQATRLSQDGGRKSMFAETTNSFWDSKNIGENVRERKSTSRDRKGSNSSIDWNWNDCPRTLQELEECLQSRKEAALKRESSSSLAHAFSQKIWNPENDQVGERTNWLEQWMETKQWKDEPFSRVSTDRRDSFVKTVEMDTMNVTPKQYAAGNVRKIHHHKQSPHSAAACPSPGRVLKSINNSSTVVQPPSTPSPSSKAKPAAPGPMRTPSPRGLNKEDKSYSAANTPSLRSMQRLNSSISRYVGSGIPNYMATTESAKARVRSQSAPRQRPSTPERDRGGFGGGAAAAALAKKRLSFPVPPAGEGYASYASSNTTMNFSQSLRSPSFKSVQAGYVGMMEQQSNQSCYTDSIGGGEISPCSTTELRWWLR